MEHFAWIENILIFTYSHPLCDLIESSILFLHSISTPYMGGNLTTLVSYVPLTIVLVFLEIKNIKIEKKYSEIESLGLNI